MSHEDFVTYEQAVKLKRLGFDWKCNHSYYGRRSKDLIGFCTYHDFNKNGGPNECSAPTLAQAQKWLREVKGIHITPIPTHPYGEMKYRWALDRWNPELKDWDGLLYETYEQALSAGIDKALELIK